MEEHLLDKSLAFIVKRLLGISRRVQMDQVHFYLHLQTHDIANYKCSSENMLKDGSQGSWLLVGLLKDTARMVVTFSEVDYLTRVLC